MKKRILSVLSLILAIALAFSCAACGKDSEPTTDVGGNDDFFTDTEVEVSTEETTDASQAQTGNTQQSGSTSTSQGGSQTGAVTVGGKSWAEVKKSIPAKLKGSTVEIVNWNPASEYAGASEAIKKFTKETGIKVKWTVIDYSVYFTKLASRVATDTAPDVCRTRTPNIMTLQNFQPISASGYDFSDAAWDQLTMKHYTVNGKAYATCLKGTHIATPQMIFYNRDAIKKYDLEDPYKLWKAGKWTWDKLLEMGETFRKVSGNESAIASSNYDPFLPFFGVQGPVEYDGTKYYSVIKTEKYLKVMQTITNLHTGTHFMEHGNSGNFDSGNILFSLGTTIYARRKNAWYSSLKSSGSLGTVPFPTISGQPYIQGMGEYEAYAIAKGAKNAVAVPYFLRYYLDPANYDMKSFFVDNQALEVHNWCMSQTNTSWPTYNGGIADYQDAFGGMFNTPSDQVKNFIDSNAAVIDTRVKTYNETIAKLK